MAATTMNTLRKRLFPRRSSFLPALALVVFASLLCAPSLSRASTTTANGVKWSYSVSGGKATVTAAEPDSSITEISIPSTLGGYSVTSIGSDAFHSEKCRG